MQSGLGLLTSSGSGCSPGAAVKGDSSEAAVRGVMAAARAACRSEHMRRQPEGDHTAMPRHSQPTCAMTTAELTRVRNPCVRWQLESQVEPDAWR